MVDKFAAAASGLTGILDNYETRTVKLTLSKNTWGDIERMGQIERILTELVLEAVWRRKASWIETDDGADDDAPIPPHVGR